MTEVSAPSKPLFDLEATRYVQCDADSAYRMVSDLSASDWSPECRGGEWVGEPGVAGSIFRGVNERTADVVYWAPVVRGRWQTEAKIVEARSPSTFSWAMCDSSGHPQDSVWAFRIRPRRGGCLLTHAFRMGEPTEGIRSILENMDDATCERFFREWERKVASDLEASVDRIKTALEGGSGS